MFLMFVWINLFPKNLKLTKIHLYFEKKETLKIN